MIGYVTLGTNDMERGAAFYDAVFAPMNARQMKINDRINLWSCAKGQPMLGLSLPFDGEAATSGNGAMVAVVAASHEMVDEIYQLALANGGVDEGAPGPRGGGNFYGGYFRDPDGNKLTICHLG
jgi:catechol 2,3-dioxygenase-like lactoylglutathione lyase family enzyme